MIFFERVEVWVSDSGMEIVGVKCIVIESVAVNIKVMVLDNDKDGRSDRVCVITVENDKEEDSEGLALTVGETTTVRVFELIGVDDCVRVCSWAILSLGVVEAV